VKFELSFSLVRTPVTLLAYGVGWLTAGDSSVEGWRPQELSALELWHLRVVDSGLCARLRSTW